MSLTRFKRPPPMPPVPPTPTPPESDDADPGVPLFRTWRGVYLFVFASFVLVVLALTLFSRVYA